MKQMPIEIVIPKSYLSILNNIYEIEKKLALHGDQLHLKRNVDRIKDILLDEKIFYEDPNGEKFNETRTDLDATITGTGTENLHVVEVIKPIIRVGDKNFSKVVQKGIVLVETRVSENGKEADNV